MTNQNLKERVNVLFEQNSFDNIPEDKLLLVARVVAEAYKDNMEGLFRYTCNADEGVSKISKLAHHFLKGWGVLPSIKYDSEIADAIGNPEQVGDLDQFLETDKYECITSCGEVIPFNLEKWLNEHPGASLENMSKAGYDDPCGDLKRMPEDSKKTTMEKLQFAYILEKHGANDNDFDAEGAAIELAKTYMNTPISLCVLSDHNLLPRVHFTISEAIDKLEIHLNHVDMHDVLGAMTTSNIKLCLLAEESIFRMRLLAEGLPINVVSELDIKGIFSTYHNMAKDGSKDGFDWESYVTKHEKGEHIFARYFRQEGNYKTLRTTILETCRQYDQEERAALLTNKEVDLGKHLFLDKPKERGNVEYILRLQQEVRK